MTGPTAVATITGHKDPRILMRYTHFRAEDLARKSGWLPIALIAISRIVRCILNVIAVFLPSQTVRMGCLPSDEEKLVGTEGISQPQGRDTTLLHLHPVSA